jgi:hypothetical protein
MNELHVRIVAVINQCLARFPDTRDVNIKYYVLNVTVRGLFYKVIDVLVEPATSIYI